MKHLIKFNESGYNMFPKGTPEIKDPNPTNLGKDEIDDLHYIFTSTLRSFNKIDHKDLSKLNKEQIDRLRKILDLMEDFSLEVLD